MSQPKIVTITGGAGQIGYALAFRIASGQLLGAHQPIILHLLEVPQALDGLKGVAMELQDCAFPLLHKVVCTDDINAAFSDCHYAFLVGARPRGPGMERKDLLSANAEIFSAQGKAINANSAKDIKVLVVGNPANTNALIASANAPDRDPTQFSAMMRLDHNRTVSQVAAKSASLNEDVRRVIVWGNHSATQYPDLHHATVSGKDAIAQVGEEWYKNEMIETVQKRGAQVIKVRGASSAASAANAALDAMHDWQAGTPKDDWTSMAIYSQGAYEMEQNLFYSYPVVCSQGGYSIVPDLEVSDFSRKMMAQTCNELKEERDAVRHLLP